MRRKKKRRRTSGSGNRGATDGALLIYMCFSFTAPDYLHGKRKEGLFFASHVEERGDGHDRDSRDDASVDTTTSARTRVENTRRRR